MHSFIRKIIHMDVINKNYGLYNKNLVGYYKLEKRNEKYRITISIDGIKDDGKQTYKIYIITKEQGNYIIKPFKSLIMGINRQVKETIQVNSEIGKKLKGLSIVAKPINSAIDYKTHMVMIGFNDEKININEIHTEEKRLISQTITETKNNKILSNGSKDLNDNKGKNQTESNHSKRLKNEKDDIKQIKEKEQKQTRSSPHTEQSKEVKELNTLEIIKKQLEEKEQTRIFDELFNNNIKMNPFENEDPNDEWVRIELTDIMFLPLEAWMLINNTFLINCYRKYKHLILGRNIQKGMLMLGIPDIYYFKGSIIANICGFNEFICCNDSNPKAGEYGYWVIKTSL